MEYELEITYTKNSNLDYNGEEIESEYIINVYDTEEQESSKVCGFDSFKDMKEYLNEDNVFEQFDNNLMIAKFDMDGTEIGEYVDTFRFSRVLFNGKLIER